MKLLLLLFFIVTSVITMVVTIVLQQISVDQIIIFMYLFYSGWSIVFNPLLATGVIIGLVVALVQLYYEYVEQERNIHLLLVENAQLYHYINFVIGPPAPGLANTEDSGVDSS